MSKPFRFGVQSFNTDSGADWTEQVQRAEALGYSAFHLADHIIGPGPALQAANHPEQNLAAIPAMAYAAAVTKNIHIGCRVFCVDYHLHVVLIKSAMTIDRLSGGRLELVVLNACSTRQLAEDLRTKCNTPYVLCWDTKALDYGAQIFLDAFVKELAHSRDAQHRVGFPKKARRAAR